MTVSERTPKTLLLNCTAGKENMGRENRTRGLIARYWPTLYHTGVSDSAHSTRIWGISVCNACIYSWYEWCTSQQQHWCSYRV